MNFKKTEQKLSSEDIVTFEQEIGLNLPELYKEHMLENNGGIPENRFFDDTRVSRFLSIKHGVNTIEKLYKNVKEVIPEKFIPFAEGSGFEFYLSLAEEDYGKVYLWFHDEENTKEVLAETFEEFLNNLTDE